MLLKKMAHKMLTATVSECLPEVLRRKVHMLVKFAGFLLLLFAFGAVQAKADSIYEIVGTLAIPGNSANPGVSETMNYSFELDYSYPSVAGAPSPSVSIVGTPVITPFGPLGQFALRSSGGVVADTANGYIGFFNPNVEIDLTGNFRDPNYFHSTIFGSYVWECLLPVCSEFWPGGLPGPSGTGLYWFGTATAAEYPVSIPEPGTLWLSVLGALTLCLMKKTLTYLVRGTL